jgi:sensor histidine kinase YesM
MLVNARRRTLFFHLAFWLVYYLLSVVFYSNRFFIDHALELAFWNILPQVLLVYINTEFLIPRYFVARRYTVYVLFTLLGMVLLYLYYYYLFPWLITDVMNEAQQHYKRQHSTGSSHMRRIWGGPRRMWTINNMMQALAIFFLSTTFRMSRLAIIKEKESAELKTENLQSELRFLRSQINPHFLFNALNNIYALAVAQAPHTPETIEKLSEILRYLIYDCNEEKVPLNKEIKYLQNYVELFKLKDESIRNISIDSAQVDGNLQIAPMLFIPFVENSFKFARLEKHPEGFIIIQLSTKNGELHFSISNSIAADLATAPGPGGIGIQNVEKRLMLLYPGQYTLQITENEQVYKVELHINLAQA